MSFCVSIKFHNRPTGESIFNEFIKRGERIIVTSPEFPSLKFGTLDEALRGIEINEIDDGLEVRICSCSNLADYHLFVIAVDVLMDMASSTALSEDGEVITNPYQVFNENWIDSQMESAWNVVSTLARSSGKAIVMEGLFLPFCVGPRILRSFGISMYGGYKDFKLCFEKLSGYLVKIQWWLKDACNTQSRLALPNPEKPDEEPLGISLITIKDGKVGQFDYVSFAPLVAFCNMDSDETVIIRIEDFRKILDEDDHFASFDEWQCRTCGGEPPVDEVKKLMVLAKRYQPENLHYRPIYPGCGYDTNQRTFIFMWNPTTSGISINDHIRSIGDIFNEDFHRSIHDWKDARMGDRFYVVKVVDDDIAGIVMTGILGSQPYVPLTWSGKGRKIYHVDLTPNMILNPYTVPMLTTEALEKSIPNFMWRGGYSGRLLSEEQAMALEKLFAPYLKKIAEKDDGINLCITRNM